MISGNKFLSFALITLFSSSGCGWINFAARTTVDAKDSGTQTDGNNEASEAPIFPGNGIRNSAQIYQNISDGLSEGLASYSELLLATVPAADRYSAKQLHQSVKDLLPQSRVDTPSSAGLISLLRFTAGSCFYAVQGEARLSESSSSRYILRNIDINSPTPSSVATAMERLAILFWKHELSDEERSILSPITTVKTGDSAINFWTALCTVFAASVEY